MIDRITSFFLEKVGRELCVFLCSMLPVIELRGAIPLGALLEMPLWKTFLLSVVGNLLPVPFILLGIRWVITLMKKIPLFARFANWLERKAEKHRTAIERGTFWGLFLFVAIPLPGTGAWTGSLVAALIHMKYRQAILAIFAGVLAAGVIMSFISYGAAAVIALF